MQLKYVTDLGIVQIYKTCFYFTAIHNFRTDELYRLPLTVGEPVHILEENEEWYRGYTITDKKSVGIFPKCYIHSIGCTIDKSGPSPIFILNQPLVVQEITSTLREWGSLWKGLYVVS